MPENDRFLAAQSVADSIAAMARPAVGGARWETRSYTGQPQYSTAVFGGTAGVVFLFADLFRVTGDPKAREVAEAAAMAVVVARRIVPAQRACRWALGLSECAGPYPR